MLNPLRNRLLASYIAILIVLLGLVGVVLLAFLATRPLPTNDITTRLTTTLLNLRVLERTRMQAGLPGNSEAQGDGGMLPNRMGRGPLYQQERAEGPATLEGRVIAFLNDEANQHDTRILVVTSDGRVIFDSKQRYQAGEQITETERQELVAVRQRPFMGGAPTVTGRFDDPDGRAWLYVGQPVRPLVDIQPDTVMLLVAAPVPQQSLAQVVRVFGNNFLRPLARAGLIGLVIAVALAFLISRSVARPLQRISHAAQHIAGGDYRQQVPVQGPEEVRALAQTFNYMAGRVASTQQAQQDFLANVSHDLRTPLTSIQGFSQAIMEGVAADPESAQRAAHIIHDEAGRLHRMVESLLDLARIEADRSTMRQHAVALSPLLGDIGAGLAFKAQKRDVTLVREISPELPPVLGDGDRLAQVFTNLIDNAIKHTPPGGTITLSAAAHQDGITVTIQDTGEGIPDTDLPRIFERFYQVDKSRESNRRSGAGLGLAIAREIVVAHGGTIRVASKVGEGTVFTVWLPLR